MGKYLWQDKLDAYPNSWVLESVKDPWSLSTDDPIEGTGCFKGKLTTFGYNTNLWKDTGSITLPNPFDFYFWIKVVTTGSVNKWSIRLYLVGGYIGVYISQSGDAGKFSIQIHNNGSLGGISSPTLNEWHLIRCKVEQIGGIVRESLYIDGDYTSVKDATWTFGNTIKVWMNDDWGGFEHYVDWFRIVNPAWDDWNEEDVVIESDAVGVKILSHVIATEFIEINRVALPEWINDATPDVDTNVWNLKPLKIVYTFRVNDANKWQLDQILTGHSSVELTDPTYGITDQDVFMIDLEAVWEGHINYAKPWLITIELIPC